MIENFNALWMATMIFTVVNSEWIQLKINFGRFIQNFLLEPHFLSNKWLQIVKSVNTVILQGTDINHNVLLPCTHNMIMR